MTAFSKYIKCSFTKFSIFLIILLPTSLFFQLLVDPLKVFKKKVFNATLKKKVCSFQCQLSRIFKLILMKKVFFTIWPKSSEWGNYISWKINWFSFYFAPTPAKHALKPNHQYFIFLVQSIEDIIITHEHFLFYFFGPSLHTVPSLWFNATSILKILLIPEKQTI